MRKISSSAVSQQCETFLFSTKHILHSPTIPHHTKMKKSRHLLDRLKIFTLLLDFWIFFWRKRNERNEEKSFGQIESITGTTPHSHPPPPPPVFEDMDGEETLLLETSRLSCAGTSFFVLDLCLTHKNTYTTQHD